VIPELNGDEDIIQGTVIPMIAIRLKPDVLL
jgi:hypothetical protein